MGGDSSDAFGHADCKGVKDGVFPTPRPIYNITYSFRNTPPINVIASLTEVEQVSLVQGPVQKAINPWCKADIRGEVVEPP